MDSLNRHCSALMQPAFQRHGFASLDLAAQWGVIAQGLSASGASPRQIKWPHATATAKARKQGGTLVLSCSPIIALDVHYEVPRIIERVNQYLGYGAIAAVKVQQNFAALPIPITLPKRQQPDSAVWEAELAGINDTELRAALARLGSAIGAKPQPNPSFSTGETSEFAQPSNSSRKTK